MTNRPLAFRLFPAPFRKWVKRILRPYIDWLVEPSMQDWLRAYDPTTPNVYRFSGEYMHSPFADAKHVPLFGDKTAYVIPKVNPSVADSPDGMPIPPKPLWLGYAEDAGLYLKIGQENMDRMRALLASAGRDIRPGQRILDFGCAAGPMLRRLKDFLETSELWGVDIDMESILWCQQHFPKQYRWAVTSTFPHLPFEDHYFDLIYCGSVYSHMADMTDAWLLEMARVLRPGGTLYLTMIPTEGMHSYLTRWPQVGLSKDLRQYLTREQLDSDFDAVIVHRSPGLHSIYDMEFFLRKVRQAFEVVSVTPNVYTFQYAMVLHRRDTRPWDSQNAGGVAEAVGRGGGQRDLQGSERASTSE